VKITAQQLLVVLGKVVDVTMMDPAVMRKSGSMPKDVLIVLV
jgi:hypothetical protein